MSVSVVDRVQAAVDAANALAEVLAATSTLQIATASHDDAAISRARTDVMDALNDARRSDARWQQVKDGVGR